MYWPNFEHAALKPDGLLRNKKTGQKTYVYTMDTWHREYGKDFFKEIVQTHENDLIEGPCRKDQNDGEKSSV